MTGPRRDQFRASRAWLRHCLADRLGEAPSRIPLQAPPGQPPRMASGWGYVSLSHTRDALLLAWSEQPIGVDLERNDRHFDAASLAQRFYCDPDRRALQSLRGQVLRREVLRQWLAKEAAIKWQGGSLASDLSCWSCAGEDLTAIHLSRQVQVPIHRYIWQNWWMAVAVHGHRAGHHPILCLI